MTEQVHYDTDHLTLEELKEVAAAVLSQYLAVMAGDIDTNDILYADPDELTDEYQFWATQVERRVASKSE